MYFFSRSQRIQFATRLHFFGEKFRYDKHTITFYFIHQLFHSVLDLDIFMSLWTNLKWLPNPASIHDYPALTVGLLLFTFILLIVDVALENALSHKFSLYPEALGELDLNRVSFYPLFHSGLFHWFLNVLTLFQPLAIFEKTHGTVYTGITLNLLAVLTALQYLSLIHI